VTIVSVVAMIIAIVAVAAAFHADANRDVAKNAPKHVASDVVALLFAAIERFGVAFTSA